MQATTAEAAGAGKQNAPVSTPERFYIWARKGSSAQQDIQVNLDVGLPVFFFKVLDHVVEGLHQALTGAGFLRGLQSGLEVRFYAGFIARFEGVVSHLQV